MKSSNSSAADSLKRAMTGLVKRPGMRGASFNSAPSDSAVVRILIDAFIVFII